MCETLTKSDDSKVQVLIDRCLEGDKSAQFKLYKQFAQPLYNVVVRLCVDPMLAEDIIQETFIKVFKHLKTYRREYKFYGWIRRIAVNQAITQLRKKKFHFVEIDQMSVHNEMVITKNVDFDVSGIIHEEIKQLPTGSRMVFSLFAIEGYSHKEIADEMNITESTSKSQYHRAKKLLKEKLSHLIYE